MSLRKLLELGFGTGFFEFLLHLLGSLFCNGFLDLAGSAVDEVLRLFESETGDLSDDLDDRDLVGTDALEVDVELGLLMPLISSIIFAISAIVGFLR